MRACVVASDCESMSLYVRYTVKFVCGWRCALEIKYIDINLDRDVNTDMCMWMTHRDQTVGSIPAKASGATRMMRFPSSARTCGNGVTSKTADGRRCMACMGRISVALCLDSRNTRRVSRRRAPPPYLSSDASVLPPSVGVGSCGRLICLGIRQSGCPSLRCASSPCLFHTFLPAFACVHAP